jgi:hypothetical protein
MGMQQPRPRHAATKALAAPPPPMGMQQPKAKAAPYGHAAAKAYLGSPPWARSQGQGSSPWASMQPRPRQPHGQQPKA